MNRIITIGREFGSGGRTIAKMTGEKLGIKVYDNELLIKIAKESGLAQAYVAEKSENLTLSDLIGRSLSGFGTYNQVLVEDNLWKMQSEVILDLAKKETCIIVGRCADEILAYNPNLVSVFITGDRESKIARVMDREGLDRKQAINKMKRMDKIRKTYHNFYCRNKWGDSRGYDICINTGKTDFDTAKNMVVECVDKLKERSE